MDAGEFYAWMTLNCKGHPPITEISPLPRASCSIAEND